MGKLKFNSMNSKILLTNSFDDFILVHVVYQVVDSNCGAGRGASKGEGDDDSQKQQALPLFLIRHELILIVVDERTLVGAFKLGSGLLFVLSGVMRALISICP